MRRFILDNQRGQIFVLAVIVLTLITLNVLLILGNSFVFKENTNYSTGSLQAVNLAESGVDKAVATLNATGGTYNGDSETQIGPGSYEVTVTSKDASTKIITSTGYIPNKANPTVKRTVKIQVSTGVGAAFNYGIQVGEGGLLLNNGDTINGSIYSNGNISGANNNLITGDAYVAGGNQPSPDQQSDCTAPNCQDYIFGKNVGGNNLVDVAQSFKPSQTQVLNKVALKLKKFGSPGNPTVRLMGDSSGKPDKNNVITSGILSANLVTNQYGFIDVTFNSSPTLTANTPYWIMIDTVLDNTNYWAWSMDSLQGYNGGSPAWSTNWQAKTPVWTAISGDLGFKAYMGGVTTFIDLTNGSKVNGSVHANTILDVTVGKDAYYQTLTNATVLGTKYPNSADPPPQAMPISDANITDWKNQAQSAGVTTGDVNLGNSCTATLGPGKIVGNVNVSNGCTITIKSPLWITGNLTASNTVTFKLDPSMGPSSGMIIVDGVTNCSNACQLKGSGTTGSYLMILSTFDSRTNGLDAIIASNSTTSGILYAPYGIIDLGNGASFKELSAWKISLSNGAILNYDTGLAGVFFSSGPSGSFSAIKGTYQLQ